MPSVAPTRVFRDLARLHIRAQRAEIVCRDVSETLCTLLTELGRAGTLPMRELVARLQLDKGWVSRAVDQLVQDGLAVRTSHEGDRRAVMVALTAAGRRQYRKLEEALDGQLDRVFARLRPDDRAQVARALERLMAAYMEEAEGPRCAALP